jgi:hypothetical protein
MALPTIQYEPIPGCGCSCVLNRQQMVKSLTSWKNPVVARNGLLERLYTESLVVSE